VAWVRKIRFSQTMGVELPGPGRGSFHLTFFDGLHSVGSSVSVQIPCPVGPRQAGQLSASAGLSAARKQAAAAITERVLFTSLFSGTGFLFPQGEGAISAAEIKELSHGQEGRKTLRPRPRGLAGEP
tara:strand:- start:90 stop:470 length:381 start_codon:yes stop_codon:yes gene_type:complete